MTSESGSEKELKEYCAEWLRRHRTQEAIVPYVQGIYETAVWEEDARQSIDEAHTPREMTQFIDLMAARNLDEVKSALPLPQNYQRVGYEVLNALSTGMTSTASNVAVVLVAVRPTTGSSTRIDEVIDKYETLQRQQDRRMHARERLKNHFPSLVELFDLAEHKLQLAKGDHNQIPGAATEMRNLLDRLRGKLFAKAKHRPKENMTWTIMAERLCGEDERRRHSLLDQEVLDCQIRRQLGDLVHRQIELDAREILIVWLLIVDFVFVVCDLKSAATQAPGSTS